MQNFLTEHFQGGEFIFEVGDPASDLYFLESGEVELVDRNGKAFGLIPAGQSFGEAAILKGGIRTASIRAKGDVICKKISNIDAAELLTTFSPLLVIMMEALLLQQTMNNAIKYS
jgi:CRP-like cAMP-binding protein